MYYRELIENIRNGCAICSICAHKENCEYIGDYTDGKCMFECVGEKHQSDCEQLMKLERSLSENDREPCEICKHRGEDDCGTFHGESFECKFDWIGEEEEEEPINFNHQPRKDTWDVVTFVLCSIMMVLAAVISTFNATGYLDGARITAIPYWAILAGYWAIRIWRR